MAVTFQDYYKILGVARGASPGEIKKAFRKLARLHHPDVAKNKAAGELKFKEINEAYEVLGDPEKRRRYDELGSDWQQNGGIPPAPDHHGAPAPENGAGVEFDGTGFSDFFASFFGGGRDGFGANGLSGNAYSGSRHDGTQPGQDVEADLLVSLEDALRGSLRKVTLRRPGDHRQPGQPDTFHVRIPPGVHEGQRIRLAGQGRESGGTGAPGDLYLRVRLSRHPDFSVQEADLHCDLDLSPWEAVLGAQVQIPTLDGSTSLRVPPGTPTGSQLRLRGLGLPSGDKARGDLYATVRLQTPSPITPEEHALWVQLANISTFKPRSER